MIHHTDDHLTVHIGDCREVLRSLPAESVHCVVTSPPYWGLRDYGTASWAGGDASCDHHSSDVFAIPIGDGDLTQPGGRMRCVCGATRTDGQLGLEATPELYIASMVEVFRAVRRVLRPDGTCWLNMGDSYANDTKWGGSTGGKHVSDLHGQTGIGRQKVQTGLKPKDLVGMPWRLAFALQADGWYLRSDIIWAKPNPMPESVTDRPTKSHEYVFLLTKSARYYYDAEAVREPHAYDWTANAEAMNRLIARGDWHQQNEPTNGEAWKTAKFAPPNPAGRNLRSVWSIATEPYPGAHFATFPQKLVEPCIKAGTSERGVCPECGAPWVREVEKVATGRVRERKTAGLGTAIRREPLGYQAVGGTFQEGVRYDTTGWWPTCGCVRDITDNSFAGLHPDNAGHPPIPATVLDPFAGSGTTGLVANRLGRRAILIDLSADYIDQAMLRNQQHPLGLIG